LLTVANIPCSSYCVIQIYLKQVYKARAAAVPAGLYELPKAGEPLENRLENGVFVALPTLPVKMSLKAGCALH